MVHFIPLYVLVLCMFQLDASLAVSLQQKEPLPTFTPVAVPTHINSMMGLITDTLKKQDTADLAKINKSIVKKDDTNKPMPTVAIGNKPTIVGITNSANASIKQKKLPTASEKTSELRESIAASKAVKPAVLSAKSIVAPKPVVQSAKPAIQQLKKKQNIVPTQPKAPATETKLAAHPPAPQTANQSQPFTLNKAQKPSAPAPQPVITAASTPVAENKLATHPSNPHTAKSDPFNPIYLPRPAILVPVAKSTTPNKAEFNKEAFNKAAQKKTANPSQPVTLNKAQKPTPQPVIPAAPTPVPQVHAPIQKAQMPSGGTEQESLVISNVKNAFKSIQETLKTAKNLNNATLKDIQEKTKKWMDELSSDQNREFIHKAQVANSIDHNPQHDEIISRISDQTQATEKALVIKSRNSDQKTNEAKEEMSKLNKASDQIKVKLEESKIDKTIKDEIKIEAKAVEVNAKAAELKQKQQQEDLIRKEKQQQEDQIRKEAQDQYEKAAQDLKKREKEEDERKGAELKQKNKQDAEEKQRKEAEQNEKREAQEKEEKKKYAEENEKKQDYLKEKKEANLEKQDGIDDLKEVVEEKLQHQMEKQQKATEKANQAEELVKRQKREPDESAITNEAAPTNEPAPVNEPEYLPKVQEVKKVKKVITPEFAKKEEKKEEKLVNKAHDMLKEVRQEQSTQDMLREELQDSNNKIANGAQDQVKKEKHVAGGQQADAFDNDVDNHEKEAAKAESPVKKNGKDHINEFANSIKKLGDKHSDAFKQFTNKKVAHLAHHIKQDKKWGKDIGTIEDRVHESRKNVDSIDKIIQKAKTISTEKKHHHHEQNDKSHHQHHSHSKKHSHQHHSHSQQQSHQQQEAPQQQSHNERYDEFSDLKEAAFSHGKEEEFGVDQFESRDAPHHHLHQHHHLSKADAVKQEWQNYVPQEQHSVYDNFKDEYKTNQRQKHVMSEDENDFEPPNHFVYSQRVNPNFQQIWPQYS